MYNKNVDSESEILKFQMIRRRHHSFFRIIPVLELLILLILLFSLFLPRSDQSIRLGNEKRTSDQEYLNLDSLIKLKLEADISPDLQSFLKNNVEKLIDVYDPNLSLSEQIQHFGSMASTAVNIKINKNESLIFVFTRVWFSKQICLSACNPDRSYLYAQVLTNDYHLTSYNMTLSNGQIIRFPSILNISAVQVNECCLGPEDPRIILNENNQILISFNMIDSDRKRKIWFYDILNHHQIPFTISNHPVADMEKNWSPFMKDNKLYFIYSYNPLKILQCSTEQGSCNFIFKTENINKISSLRGGTQLIRFRDSHYYVGIARSTISCDKCQQFYRPHLFVLSTMNEQFRIVYVSEPLKLDNIPAFTFYFMSEEKSKDFCNDIIRIMTPGSIVSWTWPDDKLIFTLSINDKKSYLVSIVGIGQVVENIISKINIVTNETIVSHSELLARKYCEIVSETNKWISNKIQMIQQYPKEKIIKSNLSSPTYPQFQLASNTQSNVLSSWITADAVNFGLLGRYLLEYEIAHNYQLPGSHLMIDAGGNHGTYGFYAASFNQSVYIFEVLLDYWIVIQESLRLNPHLSNRMTLYPLGVGNQHQQWKISPGEGLTRLDSVQSNLKNDSTTIHVYSLDDFIFQSVSVLKIDIEGFEIRALQGAQQLISKFGVGAILIEIASKRWSWYQISIDEGISVLEQVTSIGHYSSYIIARNDQSCPASEIGLLNGITRTTNLSMLHLQTGKYENASNMFHLSEWKTIMVEMKKKDWSCNFWLENDVKMYR